jgi:GGDEF domain-containing protein
MHDVARAVTSTLRSYDVTVRWDGDEFVCTMSDATRELASDRAAEIQRTLKARRPDASISVGLAELDHDDTLVARARAALHRTKANRFD